ncbi:MAG: DEAD/DEAH box helicase [archaeon]|nr:DEAD/DEAH box helicase [Candidatus Micrarchaeota archaeon]
MNFSELNINDDIKKALQRKGFSEASEIQEKVIPEALSGKDIVGKSRTGTGKTAAFAIPIIEKTVPGQGFSTLVVVPTRELARQVKEEIASIAINSNIKTIAVFGGQNIRMQIDLLRRKPEIIVGTPGRLLDFISRRVIGLEKVRFLVLDEADKMFDMGFREDVEKIISFIPRERQTMLFSATMPAEILSLIERYMNPDKLVFDLSEDNAPVHEVDQFYVMVDKRQKIDALQRVIDNSDSKILVFCRTKRTVDWLEMQLSRRRISAVAIHGDKPQSARNRIIENFKSSREGVLIATDIVARGIHVDDIDYVINFDFPQEAETYIHRIGRTARQGRKGTAISFCSNLLELNSIERVVARNNTVIQQLQ